MACHGFNECYELEWGYSDDEDDALAALKKGLPKMLALQAKVTGPVSLAVKGWAKSAGSLAKSSADLAGSLGAQAACVSAQLAAAAGRALGCRGYFRVDMRERHGILYVLDVNPNPDITPDGGFLRQCREAGFSDEQTVHTILELAFEEDEGGTTRE